MNPSYTLRNKRVWVAGHRGLVGSAIVRRLAREGCEVVTAPRETVDLRRPDSLERWMRDVRPQAVFLAAARVGGIYANDTRPAELIYDNLAIQTTVVEAAPKQLGSQVAVGELTQFLPPIGPAVANALARLGLQRPRRLPMGGAVRRSRGHSGDRRSGAGVIS